MHDPPTAWSRESGVREPQSLWRVIPGIILLGIGVFLALWIVLSLVRLLSAQSQPPLVAAVVPEADTPVKLGLPAGQFTLPPEVFTPIGYLLVCFVYAIAASIAMALLNGGVTLLQPDVTKVLRRLAERLERK